MPGSPMPNGRTWDELTLAGVRGQRRSRSGPGPSQRGHRPARDALPGTSVARASVGAAHPCPVPGRTAGRGPAGLRRNHGTVWSTSWASIPACPYVSSRPVCWPRTRRSPWAAPLHLLLRSRDRTVAGNLREQLSSIRRPSVRVRTAERISAHPPARDTGRPRRGRQDQTGGGGRCLPLRGAPGWCLAGRAGQRHRARRCCTGRRGCARGGRVIAGKPPFAGINGRAHRCTIWPGDHSSSSSTTVSM